MKTAVVLVALFGACMAQVYHVAQPVLVARPALAVSQPIARVAELQRKPIAILRQSSQLSEDGNFNYDFESENGIQTAVSGSQKALGQDQLAQVVQGSYSYTAPDGTPIQIQYTADENGFRADGAAIPTPPPIPEAIARSLQLLPTLEEFERREAERQARSQQQQQRRY